MRHFTVTLYLALCAAAPARAADPPAAPADDLDALTLADKAPTTPAPSAHKWRIFVEGAAGQGTLRGTDTRFDTSRGSVDFRYDANVAQNLRGVLSDRLDLVHSNGVPHGENVNTLREAYLSWARTDEQIIDIGRINLRHGAALGFNPTDWFKEGALRSIVSPDPAVLRENRQGTVALQGQKLWRTGSLTAAFSPKLADAPNSATFALDAGATNPRNRWLLAGSYKVNDKLSPELLLYGGADTPTQVGLNASTLIGEAAVVFGEISAGKGRSLTAQALNLAQTDRNQRRAALGLTYTTGFNLSVTAEAEYNSAAPDRDQWNALPGLDPAAPLRALGTAQTLQDLPVRRAWFFYATWKDVVLRRLDVSGFVRHDAETDSRAQWLEARYHWDRAELALQWQLYSGRPGSVYGSIPQRRTVELVLRAYL
ncbi:MAG TPA: hypothetical protein VIM34_09365 [Burkholderiaceae bacterium]